MKRKTSSGPKPSLNPSLFIFGLIGVIVIIFILIPVFRERVKSPKAEGLVSFVIDDWGYNLNNVNLVLQIDRPITLAVLPRLRYSKEIIEKVRSNSSECDIILHLPLESKSGRSPEPDTIRCNTDKDKILDILEKDIKSVPGAIGVSNHQGSRVTENRTVMKTILRELKKRNLFFFDSRTTSLSVARHVAREIGLRSAERDVFLDLAEKKDEKLYRAYIKKQIMELVKIARQKGSAVGIGHDKRLTLEVIKESVPEIEKENIRIVPLKKLVR